MKYNMPEDPSKIIEVSINNTSPELWWFYMRKFIDNNFSPLQVGNAMIRFETYYMAKIKDNFPELGKLLTKKTAEKDPHIIKLINKYIYHSYFMKDDTVFWAKSYLDTLNANKVKEMIDVDFFIYGLEHLAFENSFWKRMLDEYAIYLETNTNEQIRFLKLSKFDQKIYSLLANHHPKIKNIFENLFEKDMIPKNMTYEIVTNCIESFKVMQNFAHNWLWKKMDAREDISTWKMLNKFKEIDQSIPLNLNKENKMKLMKLALKAMKKFPL